MARAALDQLLLDRIVWIPTGAPGYRRPPVASGADRVAMLRLALGDEPRFVIDERELSSRASGYTVDTLRALRRELGEAAELYLLLGGDQYEAFDKWREPGEVARLARLAVFARPGHEPKERNARLVAMPLMNVSASDVRARAARGASLEGLVPSAVANYIQQHRLYR